MATAAEKYGGLGVQNARVSPGRGRTAAEKYGRGRPEKPEIFSGGTLQDVLDAAMVPFSVIPSLVKGGVERQRRYEAGTQQPSWDPREFIPEVGGDLLRGIKEKTYGSDVIRTISPQFGEEHPWLTESMGLAGDIITGGGPQRLAGAALRPVVGRAAPAVGAALEKIPHVGRAQKTYRQVLAPVRRIEQEARRKIAAVSDPIRNLITRTKVHEKYVNYTQRGIEQAMDDAFGEAGDVATKEFRAFRAGALGARRKVKRKAKLAKDLTKRAAQLEAGARAPMPRPSPRGGKPAFSKPTFPEEGVVKETAFTRQVGMADETRAASEFRGAMKTRAPSKLIEEQALGPAERMRRRAIKAQEEAEAATVEMESYIKRAQDLGAKRGQVLGRRTPGPRGIAAIRDVAERGAVNKAHAAAAEYQKQALKRVEKVAGKSIADDVSKAMDELQASATERARRAVEQGALAPGQVEKYGKYHLWRGFERNVHPEAYIAAVRQADPELAATLERLNANSRAFHTGHRQGVSRTLGMKRQHLTPELRRTLGELPVSERVSIGERAAAVSTSEAFRMRQFSRRFGVSAKQFGQMGTAKQAGLVKVPEAERWGRLRDSDYIPRWLAAHLGMPGVEGAGWESRIARLVSYGLPSRAGEAINWWTSGVIGPWKALHTIYNIPTQARNGLTNAGMTYLAGKLPAAHVPAFLVKGAAAVRGRSAAYLRARQLHPGFDATFRHSELGIGAGNALEARLGGIWKGAGTVAEKAAATYEFSELSAKMAVFLYHTERGMAAQKAARLAMEAVFDYGDVTRIVNWLRRSGVAPFITFPVKATKALGKSVLETPARIGRAARAIEAPTGVIPQGELADIYATMKEEDRGKIVPIPFKTAQGERLTFDVGYIVPWGPLGEKMGLSVLQLMSVPRIVEDVARNESSFTRREVYNADMPFGDRTIQIADYIGEQLGPGWIVRGIPKILASGKPKYRYAAAPEQPSAERTGRAVAAELLGLRARPYVPSQQMALRKLETDRSITRLKSDIRKWAKRAAVDESFQDEAQRNIAVAIAQIQKRAEEFTERAEARR